MADITDYTEGKRHHVTGNQENLTPYKRSEGFQPATTPLPFGEAGRKLGEASNALSAFGSTIAINTAIGRAEIAGIEFGKNPSGDILPAFNKTDEAFNEAYRNTAKATLALQGAELLNNSVNTVLSANKLTPELIEQFQNNMLQGIAEISEQAPTVDREAVRSTLTSDVITSRGQLDRKLIEQQKQELKDTFAAYAAQTDIEIFNVSSSGDIQNAKSKLDSLTQSIKEQVSSGLLDKVQADAAIKTARATYLTGREFSYAQEAISAGELDQFLSDYGKEPPKDMTPTEWVEVGNNLLKLLNFQDSTDAKKQATLGAEIDLNIQRGTVTNELITRAEQEQTPEAFIKTLTKIEVANQKNKKKLDAIKTVSANWGDAGKFSQFDTADINDTYDILWKDLAQKSGLPDFAAKTEIAASAGGQIPNYINELGAYASSNNPESLQMASDAIKHVQQAKASNLEGLDSKARAMVNSFDRKVTGNMDPMTAAKEAEKAVFQVDESMLKMRETQWTIINKDTFGSNNDKLESGAKKISGMQSSNDPVVFSLKVQQLYHDAFLEVGNEIDAQTQVQNYINAAYGTTYVNGFKEEGQFGTIEKALNISEAELPIVQIQVAEQAAARLESYNKGDFAYKYKFKAPITITFEEREAYQAEYDKIRAEMQFNNPEIRARVYELEDILKSGASVTSREVEIISNELAEIKSRPKSASDIARMKELHEKIRIIENPGRPIIQQIDSDGNKTDYYVGIYRAPSGQKALGQPVYYMRLINMDGRVENFTGAAQHNGGEMIYVPNTEDLQSKLGVYIHTANAGGDAAISKMRRNLMQHKLEAEQFISKKRGK